VFGRKQQTDCHTSSTYNHEKRVSRYSTMPLQRVETRHLLHSLCGFIPYNLSTYYQNSTSWPSGHYLWINFRCRPSIIRAVNQYAADNGVLRSHRSTALLIPMKAARLGKTASKNELVGSDVDLSDRLASLAGSSPSTRQDTTVAVYNSTQYPCPSTAAVFGPVTRGCCLTSLCGKAQLLSPNGSLKSKPVYMRRNIAALHAASLDLKRSWECLANTRHPLSLPSWQRSFQHTNIRSSLGRSMKEVPLLIGLYPKQNGIF
jgi:hypothetical protein